MPVWCECSKHAATGQRQKHQSLLGVWQQRPQPPLILQPDPVFTNQHQDNSEAHDYRNARDPMLLQCYCAAEKSKARVASEAAVTLKGVCSCSSDG